VREKEPEMRYSYCSWLIEKTIDTADKQLYLTFIDYRKAFDMVNHKKLFDVILSMEYQDISWN